MNLSLPALSPLVAFTAGITCAALAGLVGAKTRDSTFHWYLAGLLGVTALVQFANGAGGLDQGHRLVWRRVGTVGELAQVSLFLYAGLSLMGETNTGFVREARWRAHGILLLAIVGATSVVTESVWVTFPGENIPTSLLVGSLGRATYCFLLLSLVLGMTQLETIFRATPDPLKYQVKFIMIGMASLAGAQVYLAAQVILFSTWQLDYMLVSGLATLISTGLIGVGLARTGLGSFVARVDISPTVIYGTATFLLVGLYLICTATLAFWINQVPQAHAFGFSSLVVWTALVFLLVLGCSRTARGRLRLYLARHFYKSKYDYRAKWLEVAEAFEFSDSVESVLDILWDLLGKTFSSPAISLWLWVDADKKFHQVRSLQVQSAPSPLPQDHPLIVALSEDDGSVGLEGVVPIDRGKVDGNFLRSTLADLCVPIRSGKTLIAFATLSKESTSQKFGIEDHDLLRGISHHAGVILAHARLAEERAAIAKVEALHQLSAFCLHDLKNLASRLSLVVQNAEIHGSNLEFQTTAMRTIANTTEKMMDLMGKLSLKSLSVGPEMLSDVRMVVPELLQSLKGEVFLQLELRSQESLPVRMGGDQLHQVVMNLLFNAHHASRVEQPILVAVTKTDKMVLLTVKDSGQGMSPQQLRTVFQPFKTTKSDGLGIGLYECKKLIETAGGNILIESQVGVGTHVSVQLPLAEYSSQDREIPGTSMSGEYQRRSI